jgi:hypothetical protein
LLCEMCNCIDMAPWKQLFELPKRYSKFNQGGTCYVDKA